MYTHHTPTLTPHIHTPHLHTLTPTHTTHTTYYTHTTHTVIVCPGLYLPRDTETTVSIFVSQCQYLRDSSQYLWSPLRWEPRTRASLSAQPTSSQANLWWLRMTATEAHSTSSPPPWPCYKPVAPTPPTPNHHHPPFIYCRTWPCWTARLAVELGGGGGGTLKDPEGHRAVWSVAHLPTPLITASIWLTSM